MAKKFLSILLFVFTIISLALPSALAATQDNNFFELIIENNSSWCSVEIYGMGKTSSADMVRFFVTGRKKQVEKIASGRSVLENNVKIIKISNDPAGVATVTIKRSDILIGGPWINEEHSQISVEDKTFDDPWNTKYYYFYTEPFCDPSGDWVNSTEDAVIKLKKGKSGTTGDVTWLPSGDKFTFYAMAVGTTLTGNWKHTASSSVGTLEGELNEDCSALKITKSAGNFDWSETSWTREQEMSFNIPAKTVTLSGDWYYAGGDGKIKIVQKTKSDYYAEVTWVPENAKYKVNIRLIGNYIIATWFDSNGSNSGTFTGTLKADSESGNLSIEMIESSGTLEWSGITWIKGQPESQ